MNVRLIVAPAVIVVAGALCGCSASGGLSAEESRDRFYATLDSTQAALGGAWEEQDDGTPRGCGLPLWQEGESYAGLRVGPMPDDVSGAVSAARDTLRERGYDTTVGGVGDVTEVRARGRGTEVITFRITDDGMTLQGESDCRPS
ncbi:hypothetical protein ACFDTO_14205 [Microbacteriaceae bacterium 4G12]